MSDAIDRARDIIERYLPAMPDQQAAFVTRDAARALDAAGLLASPERDEAIRADERGRCSVVHATLTDEALAGELVRRGVLREERVRDNRICRCNLHRADPLLYAPCDAHEPITLPTRYVTEWEPGTDEGGAS